MLSSAPSTSWMECKYMLYAFSNLWLSNLHFFISNLSAFILYMIPMMILFNTNLGGLRPCFNPFSTSFHLPCWCINDLIKLWLGASVRKVSIHPASFLSVLHHCCSYLFNLSPLHDAIKSIRPVCGRCLVNLICWIIISF